MKGQLHKAVSSGIAAVMLAGCSVTTSGFAVPDPDDPAIKLSTGGLSTKPRQPETSEAQKRVLAANMLAERTVAPWEIDSTFVTAGNRSVQTILNVDNLGSGYEDSLKQRFKDAGLLYGFMSSRYVDKAAVSTGFLALLLRVNDARSAAGVVEGFRSETSEGADYAIAERPDVVAKKYDSIRGAEHTTIAVMFSVGPLAIFMRSWGPDVGKAHRNAVQAIDKQRELLKGFAAPGAAEVEALPADRESIVSYTVTPDPLVTGRFVQDYGFRNAAGQLHWDTSPVATAKVFADEGVDLAGYGRNILYRARDEAGARRMAAEWYRWLEKEKGVTEFSIAGLPEAKCRSYTVTVIDEEPLTSCYLPVGRYVSEFTDAQPEKVRQVTSAAFLILRDVK